MNYKTTTHARKYHYWRGFRLAIIFSLSLVFIGCAIAYFSPAPDYTMTPAQYQGYLDQCAMDRVTLNAIQAQTAQQPPLKPSVSKSNHIPVVQSVKVTAPTQLKAPQTPKITPTSPTIPIIEDTVNKAKCLQLLAYTGTDIGLTTNYIGCVASQKQILADHLNNQAHTPDDTYAIKRLLEL